MHPCTTDTGSKTHACPDAPLTKTFCKRTVKAVLPGAVNLTDANLCANCSREVRRRQALGLRV